MTKEEVCPVCGCGIGKDSFEKEGIIYCCEACAEHRECECGCRNPVKVQKKSKK